MTITSLPSSLFSGNIPDIEIYTSATRIEVKIYFEQGSATIDTGKASPIYDECLYPDNDNAISVCELDQLIAPFAEQYLMGTLLVTATEQTADASGNYTDGTRQTTGSTVYYCSARVEETAAAFVANNFLTRLDGKRLTSMGRLEYLHYYGSDSPTCAAHYTDGTIKMFTPTQVGGADYYKTIDVSPGNFAASGKTLMRYVVTAGSRSQEFEIDFANPDCAPILAFTNCFGVQEIVYCTGTLESSPDIKYTQNYVKGILKTQSITQVRTMKADTGVLTFPMADWLQDLFTSKEIYLVEMVGGYPNVSEDPIAITDCKTSYTNDRDSLPRFTFDYRRATRNTSVIPIHREGRIFDTSFDFTFN